MSVQDPIEIDGDPTALYRLFSEDGILLYIGITRNIPVRFAQHAERKPWWPHVARKTMTWYGSRGDARAAEDAAIASEAPVFNIARISSEVDPPRTGRRRTWAVSVKEAEAMLAQRQEREERARVCPAAKAPAEPAAEPADEAPAVPDRIPRYAYVRLAEQLEARFKHENPAAEPVRLTVRELQDEYGESRTTVTRALSLLRKKGLVVTLQGMGTFPRRGPRLVYVQIADDMAANIEDGIYGEYGRLPGEHDLVETYGASRESVRRAIRILVEKNLIEVVPSKGMFVLGKETYTGQLSEG